MEGLSYCNAVFLHFNPTPPSRSVSHDRWHGVPMGSRRSAGRRREHRIASAAARSEQDRGLLASLFYRWVLKLSLLLRKVMCRRGRGKICNLVCNLFIIIIRWRYSPRWALASTKIWLQVSRFLALSFHSFIPIFLRSMDTSSSHLILGLPM